VLFRSWGGFRLGLTDYAFVIEEEETKVKTLALAQTNLADGR